MVKPFRQLELLSRIKALTRRAGASGEETPLVCGELRFNPVTRQLLNGQEETSLTRTEGSVLYQLMKSAGQVVTYSRLAESVWGEDYADSVDALRVYIRRLREKIEADPNNPEIVLTKVGVGYSVVKPD
jgi:two-component system KDP operon response regulator KdpE